MAGKGLAYALAAVQIVVGIIFQNPALIISGVATAAGTALTPTPPRPKELRDSSAYGIDQFDNPRGPETSVPILYGEHTIKPAVIVESVREAVEGVSPGDVRNTRMQEFRWLGVVAEGVVSSITDIRLNDRELLSDLLEVELGDGRDKKFTFPHRHVVLGDDETPGVEILVDDVLVSPESDTSEHLVVLGNKKRFELREDDKRDRVLVATTRVFLRGPGVAEYEQLRGVGTYRWSVQKLRKHKIRLRWKTRPPAGFTARVTYEVLRTAGAVLTQDTRGVTKVVFGTKPGNGKTVSARYRTSSIPGLQIVTRPGTIDQDPIDGFADLEQSRNPPQRDLARAASVEYSTGGRDVDNLRIGLVAPRGMIHYDNEGGTSARKVELRIEYRPRGATSWKRLRSSRGDTFRLIGQRGGTMRWEIDVLDELRQRALEGVHEGDDDLDNFERGSYDLRVTRVTAHPSDSLVSDDIEWSHVTEVLHEGFTYPGTALLGLKGRVGAAISGSGLRVSCVAKRGVLWDPRTDAQGGARDLGSSQNVALAIRDLITSAEGAAAERYGGGHFFSGSDFFLGTDGTPAEKDGLIAFADFCDAWVHRPGDDATRPAGPNNGERRCRLNVVLDTPQSLMETVGDLAFIGYCFAAAQGARWRFPLDQDGDAVFTFVDDVDPPNQNMSNLNLKLDEWAKSPTSIEGAFWNEVLRHDRDELLLPVADVSEGTPTVTQRVELRGITRETEAVRMLRHLAEQARALPLPCTWDAHPGIQFIEAGDIVTVKTRVPHSTGSSATQLKVRVLAAIVSRDEEGRLRMRYAGRVMDSSTYALSLVSEPASSTPRRAQQTISRPLRRLRRRARITGVRARVQ